MDHGTQSSFKALALTETISPRSTGFRQLLVSSGPRDTIVSQSPSSHKKMTAHDPQDSNNFWSRVECRCLSKSKVAQKIFQVFVDGRIRLKRPATGIQARRFTIGRNKLRVQVVFHTLYTPRLCRKKIQIFNLLLEGSFFRPFAFFFSSCFRIRLPR